jgi:sulfonate transport system substrate-binding protein
VAQQAGARLLADGEGLVDNLDFFLTSRTLAEAHPEFIKVLKEEIARTDAWVNENPRAAAEQFAADTKIPVEIAEIVIRKAPRGILEIDDRVIAYQQNVADTFFEAGIIPRKLAIRDAVIAKEGSLTAR